MIAVKQLPFGGVLAVAFLLMGVILFSLLFFPSAEKEMQPIPSFFTVRVQFEHAAEWEKKMADSSLDYFSAYNQKVQINCFNEYQEISVMELIQKMQPGDLQLDPFLQGIPSLFYDDQATYVYIKAKRPSIVYYFQLKGFALPKGSWQLMGFSLFSYLIAFVLLVIATSLSWFFFPRLHFWVYLYLPLALILLFMGAFFPFWCSFLIWGGLLFYGICDLTLWRKKLRLHLPLYKEDLKRATGVFVILLVPVLLLSPLLIHSVSAFFLLLLLALYGIVAFMLFAYFLYQKECGPGFSGFLVQPLLRSKIEERVRLIQASFYFVLLLLIPSMLFIQMGISAPVVEKNPFQTLSYCEHPRKMIPRLQRFYRYHEKQDNQLVSHGVLYCIHSSYQRYLHQGVDWNQLTHCLLENKTIEGIPSYQMISNNQVKYEVPLISASFLIKQWKPLLKEAPFRSFLFQKGELFSLQKEGAFFRKKALSFYWIAFIVNLTVSFLLFFWLVPIRIRKKSERSFILLKELVHS